MPNFRIQRLFGNALNYFFLYIIDNFTSSRVKQNCFMIRRRFNWDLIYTLFKKKNCIWSNDWSVDVFFIAGYKRCRIACFEAQSKNFYGYKCLLVGSLCVENIKMQSVYWLFVENTHLLKIKCIFQELHLSTWPRFNYIRSLCIGVSRTCYPIFQLSIEEAATLS